MTAFEHRATESETPPRAVEHELAASTDHPAPSSPSASSAPDVAMGPPDPTALLDWIDDVGPGASSLASGNLVGFGQQSSAPTQLNPNAPQKPVAPLTLTNEDDLKAHADRATAERLLTSKDLMSGAHATQAMEILVNVPEAQRAKVIDGLDDTAFENLLDRVPEGERERFEALVESSANPKRKVRLWGEFHKSRANNDIGEHKGDIGKKGSRTDEQKQTLREHKRRKEATATTNTEVDVEVTELLERAKSGTITLAEVDEMRARKDLEYDIELEHNLNLTAESERRPDGSRVAWSAPELAQVQASLSQIPEEHLQGKKAFERIERHQSKEGESKGGEYLGDHINIYDQAMVRREGNDGSLDPKESSCASLTGESPVPVSVGAPGSRSPEPGEILEAEARRQEPSDGRQGRGPQHEVKLAASTDTQSGSRADHFTAKATSSTKRSEAVVEDSRGVWSAARVQGEARNTGDPSARPRVRGTRTDQAEGQAIAVQRKSEGIVVPVMTTPQNVVGGKGPWGGHDDENRNDKGMVATRGAGNPSHRRSNSPDRSSSEDNVERLQRRLGAAAKRDEGRRFHALFDRIWRRDVLEKAWNRVKRNKGAAGVDAETIDSIRALGEESFLNDLSKTLRAGRYRPQAVRRHWIPKANGGRRPLGIPTVRDRVVQTATKLILEPIFEVDFKDCSYGFRPGRSATQALEAIRLNGSGRKGDFVLDADIRDFFGSLDREILMERVKRRISDRRVLSLIWKWLEAGVMEDGRETKLLSGTPQGGVISPLLSNIYLSFLDERWTKQCADLGTLVRYADDFVIVCNTWANLDEADRRVKMIFKRLKLQLHPDKTRKVELRDGKQGFDFLGCHLHKRMSGRIWENERKRVYFLQRWPSKTSVKRVKQRVKELAPNNACHRDLRETIAKINPVLRGWGGYFATGNASAKFSQVDSYVWSRLRKLMRRRKGRHLRPGEMGRWTRHAFHDLGLHKLLGTIRYPGRAQMPRPERPPVSRMREIRTYGLNGGLTHVRRKTEEG